MLIPWESLATMVVRISFDILLKAFSCLCPTCFKQNSACTSPVAWYLLVVIKAGHEHPVLQDPCDFIALFPVLLETNVPVLLHRNHDFVYCFCQHGVSHTNSLSSFLLHSSISRILSCLWTSCFQSCKSWPWWLLRWCIKSPVLAKSDLEGQGK